MVSALPSALSAFPSTFAPYNLLPPSPLALPRHFQGHQDIQGNMLTVGAVKRIFSEVVTRPARGIRLQVFGALPQAGHCVHSAVEPTVPGKYQRAAQRGLATRTRDRGGRVPCCLMGYDLAL